MRQLSSSELPSSNTHAQVQAIQLACMGVQVEKAPQESYADVGGLEQQIMEIKEAVELPLTHPELYEDIGIKPPKASPTSRAVDCLLETHSH